MTSQASAGAGYVSVYATSFSIPGSTITLANGQVFSLSNPYVALPDAYLKFRNLGFNSSIPSFYQPYYLSAPNGSTAPLYTVDIANSSGQVVANQVMIADVGPWNEDDNWWAPVDTTTTIPNSCPVTPPPAGQNWLSNAQVDGICPGPANWRRAAYYLLYQHGGLPFFQSSSYSPTGPYNNSTAWPPVMPLDCPEASLASINNDSAPCVGSLAGYNGNSGGWLRDGTYDHPVLNQSGIDLGPAADAALGWTWPSSGFIQTNISRLPGGPWMQASAPAVNVTTAPGVSPASQQLSVSNSGFGVVNWTETAALPSWLTVSDSSGPITQGSTRSLAAGASDQLTLTFNIPATDGAKTYGTNLTFADPNAGNSPLTVPVTVVAADIAKTWYFAEGYTAPGFDTYLTLANPTNTAAKVAVTYLVLGGSPATKDYTVNANARQTVHVNSDEPNQSVSMIVSTDAANGPNCANWCNNVPIVAERPMYFNASFSNYSVASGTDTLGATGLSQDFSFGYLDTTAKHDTYFTILNNNATQMTVTTDYSPAAGGNEIETTNTVPANARGTIHVNLDKPSPSTTLPAGMYSARVHLSLPGLVERPLYFVDSVTGLTGAADVIGVPAPQTAWYFAEGYTDSSQPFSERYILSNPCQAAAVGGCASTPATTVTVTFMDLSGATTVKTYSLNAGQQTVVNVNSVLGNYASNSATVTATQPMLAERLMSFRYSGQTGTPPGGTASDPGATDVLGAAAPSHLAEFAEGYTASGFAEYLTLQNPDPAQTAYVTVTLLPLTGAPVQVPVAVGPHTRATVFLNPLIAQYSLNTSFSLQVESNLPIVAERPMYFAANGSETGGSDIVGYQPPGS